MSQTMIDFSCGLLVSLGFFLVILVVGDSDWLYDDSGSSFNKELLKRFCIAFMLGGFFYGTYVLVR